MDTVLVVALLIWSGAVTKILPLGGSISVVAACLLILVAVTHRHLRVKSALDSLAPYTPVLLLAALSGVWADDPINWAGKLISFLLMLVTASAYAQHRQDALTVLVRTLMVYGIIHSGLSLVLIYSGSPLGRASDTHLIGILTHKTALTNMSAFCAVAATWCLFWDRPQQRITAAISLGLSVWILLIGGGGQAALGAALAVALMFTHRHISQRVALMGVVLVGIAAAVLPFADQFTGVLSMLTGKDGNLTGRLAFWQFAREKIGEQPFLGYGFSNVGYTSGWTAFQLSSLYNEYGSVVVAPNMHNQWIELTYMLGYPGLLLGFAFFVLLPSLRLRYASGDFLPIVGLCTLHLALSAFNSNLILNAPEPFFYFCALACVAAKATKSGGVVLPNAQANAKSVSVPQSGARPAAVVS